MIYITHSLGFQTIGHLPFSVYALPPLLHLRQLGLSLPTLRIAPHMAIDPNDDGDNEDTTAILGLCIELLEPICLQLQSIGIPISNAPIVQYHIVRVFIISLSIIPNTSSSLHLPLGFSAVSWSFFGSSIC